MICEKHPRLTIFLAEAACMMIELCASYLFSPYYGTSNLTWTGLIGVILLSASIGNFIGGRMVVKEKRDMLPFVFMLASAFTFFMGYSSDVICSRIKSLIPEYPLNSLVSSLLLLAPSSIFLGMVPPLVMAKSTADRGKKGIGVIYMMSTIGGLAGTFIGGYLLIPVIGVSVITAICGCVLFIAGLTFKYSIKIVIVTALAIAIGILDFKALFVKDSLETNTAEMVFDSEYDRIIISENYSKEDNKPVRTMKISGGFESATYTDEDSRYDLFFNYLKAMAKFVLEHTDAKNIMMMGGAAYQFPKYVLAYMPDISIDVVEIDGMVTDLALKYFYLQDCINEYDPDLRRLGLYNEDAKLFIGRGEKKYDIIFNDTFAGDIPARTLTTVESVREIKAMLTDNGVYATNIISGTDEENGKFLRAECRTLSEVFRYVYINEVTDTPMDPNQVRNFLVVATDNKIPGYTSLEIDYSDGILLTDDYCPVENLIPKARRD